MSLIIPFCSSVHRHGMVSMFFQWMVSFLLLMREVAIKRFVEHEENFLNSVCFNMTTTSLAWTESALFFYQVLGRRFFNDLVHRKEGFPILETDGHCPCSFFTKLIVHETDVWNFFCSSKIVNFRETLQTFLLFKYFCLLKFHIYTISPLFLNSSCLFNT